ncbi:MAG: hypothetical protein ACRDP1_10170 [Nocardioidaceae bacterium]
MSRWSRPPNPPTAPNSPNPPTAHSVVRPAGLALGALCAVVGLAACSSSAPTTAPPPTATGSNAGGGGSTGGTGDPGSGPPATGATCSTPGTGASTGPETNPPGDIPDTTVYVRYRAPGSSWSLTVPEGWSRTTHGAQTVFTDKLNSVTTVQRKPPHQPTAAQVAAQIRTDFGSRLICGHLASDKVSRTAGTAVHVTFHAKSAPNAVTGTSVADDVERYVFWRHGTEVDITVSGPHGADNVDPWRTVTDSFRW